MSKLGTFRFGALDLALFVLELGFWSLGNYRLAGDLFIWDLLLGIVGLGFSFGMSLLDCLFEISLMNVHLILCV